MPRTAPPASSPDLTSVRTLITSVTVAAKAFKLTTNAIYRWIRVNRIPGKYVIHVAKLYDVEVRDLLPLTGSDKANNPKVVLKPKKTLEVLQEVYVGAKTLDDAAAELKLTKKSLHLIMFHWGDQLPTLYSTLKQLDEKRISLDEACVRLGVTKYTLHGIRKKYGFAPGRLKRTRPVPKLRAQQALRREKVIEVIAGTLSAQQAATDLDASYRSMFRYIEDTTHHKLNDLSHWPATFRRALAEEIDKKLPNYAEKWLEFVKNQRLVLQKHTKYPKTPQNWAKEPLKRLLVAVLLDEATVEALAAARGGDPAILEGLFSGDLQPLGVSFSALRDLSIHHQMAVVDVLLATLSRKRRVEA